MRLQEIYTLLDSISPFELQEKWDNSGINLGNPENTIEKIYISLDIDLSLVESMEKNSLLITHHPLIFSPLKTIQYNNFATILLQKLIQKDISVIAMHTNIDKTHLNEYVATQVLPYPLIKKEDFVCYLNIDKSFDSFTQEICAVFELPFTKSVQCHNHIQTAALTTGSGMSLLSSIEADCFLTGDIKYHDAMDAKTQGISLIDIGHYESEQYFCDLLQGLLAQNLKKNQIQGIISGSKNPFHYTTQK